jgi:hypothetical protein
MIRYSDYNGCQDDVVIRDGTVVPFDRDAARDMARHAHMLAMDVPERSASVPVTETETDSVSIHEAELYA